MTRAPRYAVYFAPEPTHPLWEAGCRWFGRDPSRPEFKCAPHEASDKPRRYGFHATLKPPVCLRPSVSGLQFIDAVYALAARTPRFAMPALTVATLRGFVALQPRVALDAAHPLRRLADACVHDLHELGVPPSQQDIDRRLAEGALTEVQSGFLRRWGYPHVFEHWHFHMTLSNPLAEDEALLERVRGDAQAHFASALAQPLACESLCVFTEPGPGDCFVLSHRIPLAP